MPFSKLSPNDRYAILGKTGSGKTVQGITLASLFAQSLPVPWEVWWLDTKGDDADIRQLRKWGFCDGNNPRDIAQTGRLRNALYFKIEEIVLEGFTYTVGAIAQAKIAEAYQRKNVILCVDEYTQVVPSDRSEGYALRNAFTRGRGRHVGVIGLTQEPVYVPRKLVSQASHIFLFTLTYEHDIKYVKRLCPGYIPPVEQGDPHGFYTRWIDGATSNRWAYYRNQKEWYDSLDIAAPRTISQGSKEAK
jgi:hypothetical protein